MTLHARCMRCHLHHMHMHIAQCMRGHWHRLHDFAMQKNEEKKCMRYQWLCTACLMHAVSLTPHAFLIFFTCHWQHMHDACRVIDTACTMHGACGVIDTACKVWHCMNDRWKLRATLAAFQENIYEKHVRTQSAPPPPLDKYINLKGLPNTKISYMRCQWHRMHDFCIRKSIISLQILNKSKISWHFPFDNSKNSSNPAVFTFLPLPPTNMPFYQLPVIRNDLKYNSYIGRKSYLYGWLDNA
jgi:hypothetical protein